MTAYGNLVAVTFGTLLSLGSPAGGPQGTPGPDRPASLPQFERWLGEWKGSGWSTTATGERVEFDLAESVLEKAGKTVLLVEGRGVRTDAGGKGKMTHDGLVLVYRDASGGYRWNGHEATSGLVDAPIELLSDGLRWSIPADAKGRTVRFTIALDGSHWHEYGEVGGEGATWTRFLEMTLRRAER